MKLRWFCSLSLVLAVFCSSIAWAVTRTPTPTPQERRCTRQTKRVIALEAWLTRSEANPRIRQRTITVIKERIRLAKILQEKLCSPPPTATPTATPAPRLPIDPPPQMCTAIYKPVCGQENIACLVAPCPSGVKTFPNLCELRAAGARFLYEGECRPDDVGPWCGILLDRCAPPRMCPIRLPLIQDYPSLEALKLDGAYPLHPGPCNGDDCAGQPPVCGLPPSICTDFACTNMLPMPVRYPNICELANAGASLLDPGKCADIMAWDVR